MKSPILSYLEYLHAEGKQNTAGAPAAYIPELGRVSPELFGISLATADGYTYEVGDARHPFTIQSISKPFSYGIALMDQGFDAVDRKVDVEPSGEAFNEISLTPGSGRPRNPMINAGAIVSTSLVRPEAAGRYERIRAAYSGFAGRDLSLSQEVFESEQSSGYRNLALGYLLRSFGIIEENPSPIVEDYFKQCSLEVTCHDLSIMAATLANNGVNPISGERLLTDDVVERVLSVMGTSGMYDGAGNWITHVGMPAKSGVGGGIIAVLPGQIGVAVFSPPLDEHGNSVRGVEVCRRLSQDLQMHFVRAGRTGRSAVRCSYSVADSPSGSRRSEESRAVLNQHGGIARVYELAGDLLFSGAESVVRAVSDLEAEVRYVVLDLLRVDEVSEVAKKMIAELHSRLALEDRELLLVDPEGKLGDVDLPPELPGARVFGSRQDAIEWCEAKILTAFGTSFESPEHARIFESSLFEGLDHADALDLRSMMLERVFDDGERVLGPDESFPGVFFVVQGQVISSGTASNGRRLRLTSVNPGATFGESALIGARAGGVELTAVGRLETLFLPATAIAALEEMNKDLAIKLWRALTRGGYESLDRRLQEVAVRLGN
ncbi:MAG: glutaminase A [Renibacterium salmoninarum]|jgi:glutaminase|nr:glutaminase A [Renibacterium salmoninarum]